METVLERVGRTSENPPLTIPKPCQRILGASSSGVPQKKSLQGPTFTARNDSIMHIAPSKDQRGCSSVNGSHVLTSHNLSHLPSCLFILRLCHRATIPLPTSNVLGRAEASFCWYKWPRGKEAPGLGPCSHLLYLHRLPGFDRL